MGIIAMIRLTKSMPRRLTDATLYSTPDYCMDNMVKNRAQHPQKLPTPEVSRADYLAIIKRVAEVEEKMHVLNMKSMTMLAEKEELMNAAINRANALEQELAVNRKVTIYAFCSFLQILKNYLHRKNVLVQALEEALAKQGELMTYIEKRKKKRLIKKLVSLQTNIHMAFL